MSPVIVAPPSDVSACDAVEDLRVDVAAVLESLSAIAAKLRETADGLDQWQRTGCTEPGRCGMPTPCVHPSHAANRLRKMARGIDGGAS